METAIFEHSEENIGEEYKNDDNVQVFTYEEQTESTESAWSDICRVCANSNDHIIPIFEAEGAEHELSDKIHCYLPIQVSKTDTLPIQLCYHCAATILAWHELISGCLDAEKQLLQMQSDRDTKESTDAKNPEDLSEELVDDPEPLSNDKQQESGSIDRREEEPERCNLGEEATKRFGETRDSRFESYMKRKKIMKCRRIFSAEKKQPEQSFVNEPDDASSRLNKLEESGKNVSLTCDKCTRVFKRASNLKRHRKNCRDTKKREIERAVNVDEEIIGEKIVKKLSMSERGKKLRSIDEDIVVRARMEANDRVYYHCNVCEKNLFSPYTFAWHMRIHTGDRPFVCHLCGKQFRVNQGLARHLRETHAGIKNFSCDICSRMFSTKRNVEDHRRIHTGERPFVCNICGKSFKQKASLFVHNRTHTDYFPFKCSHCDQEFRTRPPLIVHLTKHTGEKPHRCDICDRSFRIKYELKRHRLVHSDEKPWQCDDCDLGFRQKRYLVNHRRINHGCAKITTNRVS